MDPTGLPARERGRLAEGIAALFLQLGGYRILERNLRCGPLEVDLVAARAGIVALVEVRMRSTRHHGRPEESVRWRKRCNLARAATRLMTVRPGLDGQRLRFDLIAIELRPFGCALRHLQGLPIRPVR